MIVSHDDFAICSSCCREDPFYSAGSQRQRSLAKNVDLLLQRAKHVRLVEMIRGCDHNRIELIGVEQLVYVGKDVGNAKPLRERTSLWTIVVADRDKLRASNARQHWKMRELRYRSSADEAKPDVRAQMRPTVVP